MSTMGIRNYDEQRNVHLKKSWPATTLNWEVISETFNILMFIYLLWIKLS